VEEALVIGIPDPYRGEAAKAFIKLRSGASPLTLDALRDFLSDKIGRHEVPAALEIRAALPRTGVGKLSKKELIEEERARQPSSAEKEGNNAFVTAAGGRGRGGGPRYMRWSVPTAKEDNSPPGAHDA
jgi:long-chain acyl-CoA synthetase